MNGKKTDMDINHINRFWLVVNIVNHVLIGFVAIYMTWYAYSQDVTTVRLHSWLCMMGYQLLLAEGIMCFYSGNAWTSMYSVRTKRHIHWILNLMGTGLALGGAILMITHVTGEHFTTTHGILGLTASILLIINLVTGLCAFFSARFRNLLKPLIPKTIHTFFGLAGYAIGMVTFYYGIQKLKRSTPESFVVMLSVFAMITLVLSSIGTITSLFRNLRALRN